MFPLTPDATTHNFPSIELPPTSPARRRTSGSDSAGSASVRSSTYSEDRFRPGGLPTIMDSEVLEPPRSPLPPVPPLQTLGKSPFQLVIERMEGAGLKMMLKRLSEDWGYPENEMDSIGEALFEQKLWSLMARQWLTQGKQLSSPAHEALLAESGEVKRILNLYGSIG
jgi:phosphoribosyl 1,2-cyclic phosphodiesterase